MIRSTVFSGLMLASFGIAFAEQSASVKQGGEQKSSKPKISELIRQREGGFIRDVRKQSGKVVIVNAQSQIDEETIRQPTKLFVRDARIELGFEKGSFDLANVKKSGQATIFIIDDPKLPANLIALDDAWGAVNVAKLKTEKEAFFKSRVRKEILRVLGVVLGAGESQFLMCLTGSITSLEDLDGHPSEQIPVDVMQRLVIGMEKLGIRPWSRTTYRKACMEGWAPQPTNEYQKAIWEKVHQLPTEPLKIKPETKKVAE